MPELPDIEAYLEALRPRVVGQRLEGVRLGACRTITRDQGVGKRAIGRRSMGPADVKFSEDEPNGSRLAGAPLPPFV